VKKLISTPCYFPLVEDLAWRVFHPSMAKVKNFNAERGFGFLRSEGMEKDLWNFTGYCWR